MNDTNSVRKDTRWQILDAADTVLAHFGYQKTTMEDIARQAGLGRRTLYLHFRNKEEVALATIDRTIERLLAELERIAQAQRPAVSRTREMLVLRVMFIFDQSADRYHAYDEMLRELRPRYMLRRQEYMEAEARVFARVLEEGKRLGELHMVDAHETAHLLILATNALMPFSLTTRQLGSREEIEQRTRRLADLLGNGLLRTPSETPDTAADPQQLSSQ